jgi:hypothetical protein
VYPEHMQQIRHRKACSGRQLLMAEEVAPHFIQCVVCGLRAVGLMFVNSLSRKENYGTVS